MSARKSLARNNHLEEAMALLIQNQAAFVEQIARNDQERLALKEWQQQTEQRLLKIDENLAQLPKTLLKALLEQLPKAVKKEIGFTPQA